MPELHRISELILKFNKGASSAEKEIELNQWVGNDQERKILVNELTDEESIREQVKKMASYNESSLREKIEDAYSYAFTESPVRRIWVRWAVAASAGHRGRM